MLIGAHNFGKKIISLGPEIIDQMMEKIQHEVEMCDSLQGFSLHHSYNTFP